MNKVRNCWLIINPLSKTINDPKGFDQGDCSDF